METLSESVEQMRQAKLRSLAAKESSAPRRVIEISSARKGRVTGWTVRCDDLHCRFKQIVPTKHRAQSVAQEHDKVVHKGGSFIRIPTAE